MSATPYRPDIDGLRAVAVLAVLVYHAWPQVLPGGFVGVDIFFVISGYLITRILLAPGLSFADFYRRRIRRIFPAWLIVLAATLALRQPSSCRATTSGIFSATPSAAACSSPTSWRTTTSATSTAAPPS